MSFSTSTHQSSLILPSLQSPWTFCSANSGNNLTTTKSTIPTIKCLFKYASPKASNISSTCFCTCSLLLFANTCLTTIGGKAAMMEAAHFARSSIASSGVGGTRPGPRELLGNMFVRMSKRMEGKRVGSRILVWMWCERSLQMSQSQQIDTFQSIGFFRWSQNI